MKVIILLFTLISYTANAQQWLDTSCNNINTTFIVDEFNSAKPRNILKIIINQAGETELNGVKQSNISEIVFKEWILDYITNPNNKKDKAEAADKVFIQLKSYNSNSKNIDVLKSYIQDVYLYLWDKKAVEKYNSAYIELKCKKRAKIFNKLPLRLVPDFDEEKNKKPNHLLVPPFDGDVIDN